MPNHVHGVIVIVASVGSIHESTLPKTGWERRTMLLPKIIGRFKMNSAKRTVAPKDARAHLAKLTE